MKLVLDKQEQWSELGRKVAVYSFVAAAALALLHGVLEGQARAVNYGMNLLSVWWLPIVLTWCSDFRYLFESLIEAGAIVFVGGKFIETRSIFTIGFDNLDKDKVRMKGPDDDNIVWIGHRYGSRLEAETVASTIESRLKESEG